MRLFCGFFARMTATIFVITSLLAPSLGLMVEGDADLGLQVGANESFHDYDTPMPQYKESSPGEFPICTDVDGPFAPFCLPENGADVVVDATYYVTWNADFYPLNATITIELRYSNSLEGDSAFTSERINDGYGYIPIHMNRDWLQGKLQAALTLYIIELDPTSDRRASAIQGPTILLHPKPVEHYKPPPPLQFNKRALYIGLPVSVGVVVVVVAGLFFGKRENRRIGLGNIMGARGRGYGIAKSKFQRIGHSSSTADSPDEPPPVPTKGTDSGNWPFPEASERDHRPDLGRADGNVFGHFHGGPKGWKR